MATIASSDWIWRAVSGCALSLAGPKSASQAESHSLGPVRMTAVSGRGGGMGRPSKGTCSITERVAARLEAESSVGIYEPSPSAPSARGSH
jgi:hypothetical protein